MSRIFILICLSSVFCLLSPVSSPPAFAAEQEQLEMDVITVYGKETYRIQKEVFDLLAPLKKEELSRIKITRKSVEAVEPPPPPSVTEYDTAYPIRPAGEIPTVEIVRTGALLYFITKKPAVENIRLEFVARDGASQEAFLKRVQKDQYVEMILPEGVYRMSMQAEGMRPAAADSIVVRDGQISLAIVRIEEIPPPPPPPKVEVEPAPPVVEAPLSVRLVPLRKAKRLPEPVPMMVTKGRITFQEQGLAHMEVRLYEGEVGFFNDAYDPSLEGSLLAVTVTDSFGNFEFPPIDNRDGFLEGTRDPVLVLSLENRFLSVQKPMTLARSVPYRYVIFQKANVEPDAGNLVLGHIPVRLRKEKPVELFQRALSPARLLPFPIRILYPAGSEIKLVSRRLEVPANADFSQVPQVLTYLKR